MTVTLRTPSTNFQINPLPTTFLLVLSKTDRLFKQIPVSIIIDITTENPGGGAKHNRILRKQVTRHTVRHVKVKVYLPFTG